MKITLGRIFQICRYLEEKLIHFKRTTLPSKIYRPALVQERYALGTFLVYMNLGFFKDLPPTSPYLIKNTQFAEGKSGAIDQYKKFCYKG